MASVTLAESAKLSQDQLIAGVIDNIVTVNRMFDLLPFESLEGNAIAYDRENAIGGAGVAGVGTAVSAAVDVIAGGNTAKNAATFTQITSALTTLIGDAEVNGMIQATRSNIQSQKAIQVASKAKSLGRQFQKMLITGSGAANQFSGLDLLCAAGQKVDTGVNGGALSFDFLDQLIDLVKDKDGVVDYLAMHGRTIRSYYALLRALPGASINETVELPSGKKVPAYRGIPILQNDWILTNVQKGGTANTASIYAGTFDDGSRKSGLAGLTAKDAAGIQVVEVGEKEDADETITRLKWYCGLALYSELGLALADGISN